MSVLAQKYSKSCKNGSGGLQDVEFLVVLSLWQPQILGWVAGASVLRCPGELTEPLVLSIKTFDEADLSHFSLPRSLLLCNAFILRLPIVGIALYGDGKSI